MLSLIPQVKNLELTGGYLQAGGVYPGCTVTDRRIALALEKLPQDRQGARVDILLEGTEGEGYGLEVCPDAVIVRAQGPAGAFYAIQTLRQLFAQGRVPCLRIQDSPDFAYRGFYHDVTRGKIPTVESLKKLVDQMAYYKLNSLQLYVEHTFEFAEYKDLHGTLGCLTAEELRQVDDYCRDNFIDFIPSLSTFGHLYELLEQPQYRHLRVRKDFAASPNVWMSRMRHHTIDPLEPESIALIQSLIDQYAPCFSSAYFNICCDETFDLSVYEQKGLDAGRIYVDFVKQIIDHVSQKGKRVMLWADILLKHPEVIGQLPEDVYFLNWNYRRQPPEEKVLQLAGMGRKQIVCPGTSTWNRLCEGVDIARENICRMAEYGYRHGAVGVLNTNWGDWGNPCSLELAMYGMVLGAEKSWSVATQPDETFHRNVNMLLYGHEGGVQLLTRLSRLQDQVSWTALWRNYYRLRFGCADEPWKVIESTLVQVQREYLDLVRELQTPWAADAYRQEMRLAAEGICLMAELSEQMEGRPVSRLTDTADWLARYSGKWLENNKPSELFRIREAFADCEGLCI